MSRWFRHYAGMMRDDKLVRVAIRSGQTIERVAWIWGAILESAAEIDDGGKFDLAADEAAYFLRADEADVRAVLGALEAAGRLAEGYVVNWSGRQFASDKSKDRQAAYRERQKQSRKCVHDDSAEMGGDAEVTSPSRHGDAPETETELETEETPMVPLAGGRRGKTLIPADWKPPHVSELPPRSRACAEQWTDASYQTEAEGFVLYWRSERKMKHDWRDTWANRVIARHEGVMRAQKFGNAPIDKGGKASREQIIENIKGEIALKTRMGRDDDVREARRRLAELEGGSSQVLSMARQIGRAA